MKMRIIGTLITILGLSVSWGKRIYVGRLYLRMVAFGKEVM